MKTQIKSKKAKPSKKAKQSKKAKKMFTKNDYSSSEGMLTSVWGPNLWHYLHTISFNYPIKPTHQNKKYYKEFILNLQHTLPCKYCRINLTNNLKLYPLTLNHLKNRNNFSRYIFNLHEIVNKMLNKTSGLKYSDVRDRYEHFRSRCSKNNTKKKEKIERKKEKGCTSPLHGIKTKCILNIVPESKKQNTFNIDKKCFKTY